MNRHPLWSTGHLQCSFNPHGAIMLSLDQKIRLTIHHDTGFALRTGKIPHQFTQAILELATLSKPLDLSGVLFSLL